MPQAAEWARRGYVRVVDEQPPNALSAGAVGDGTLASAAADTAAINACLLKGGVTLPHRHLFTLSDRITSDLDEVRIVGGGGLGKLQLAPGVNKNAVRINTAGVPTTRLKRVVLQDLYIDHQAQAGGQALAGSGIEGCLIIYSVDEVIVDNFHVANPLNVGADIRACKYVRVRNFHGENLLHSGAAGNMLNIGAHATGGGEDYLVDGFEAIGGGDVALWMSGVGAKRLSAENAYIRGDALQRTVADAEVIAGALNVVHSETAGFTTADIGKLVYLINAGARTGPFRIAAILDAAHAQLDTNATAMVGATAAIGIQNSGVIAEGGNNADTTLVNLDNIYVDSPWNVGAGWTQAGGAGVLKHKESMASRVAVHNAQPGSTAFWMTGRNLKLVEFVIDAFQGTGLVMGSGLDFDEYGLAAVAGTIEAAANATGAGISVGHTDTFANFIRDWTLAHVLAIGNAGGSFGLDVLGKVKDGDLFNFKTRDWAKAGARFAKVAAGAAPAHVRWQGGYAKNNNRAGVAAGNVSSNGVSIETGSDSISLNGVTLTDDQAVKTQERGYRYAAGATNGSIRNCDLRNNKSGATDVSTDAGFIAENNNGWPVISVASAAALTLPGGRFVNVTGTTAITSIAATFAGDVRVLKFAAALTLTDGGNLLLAGNFVTTADDTITLVCDGTNWIETARSVN